MIKRSEHYFRYPPNLSMLDLATLVSMYRNRGEPRKAPSGEYLGCSYSHKLVREAKSWFGLYYSQTSWDALLTKDSGGYPLTEAELNVLGLAAHLDQHPNTREFAEKNCGVTPQLGYMIVNDLKTFGFIEESEGHVLTLTRSGEDALNGIARRIYDKKYIPEMLLVNRMRYMQPHKAGSQVGKSAGADGSGAEKPQAPQIDLF